MNMQCKCGSQEFIQVIRWYDFIECIDYKNKDAFWNYSSTNNWRNNLWKCKECAKKVKDQEKIEKDFFEFVNKL